jgi:hypothetical protein
MHRSVRPFAPHPLHAVEAFVAIGQGGDGRRSGGGEGPYTVQVDRVGAIIAVR